MIWLYWHVWNRDMYHMSAKMMRAGLVMTGMIMQTSPAELSSAQAYYLEALVKVTASPVISMEYSQVI